MASENLVTQESYNPNHLLDILIERLNLKTMPPCRGRWK
jgi:hypothetical protein